jgi:transposase-like protein
MMKLTVKTYRPNTAISIYEFSKRFPNEKSARLYLEQSRWNGNITCPICKSTKIGKWGKNEGWHRCGNCKKPFNVRTNSIFEKSKIPVFGIVERQGRMMSVVVPDTGKSTLQGIIRQNVQQGTVVCTDEWRSYIGLGKDYTHLTVNHSAGQYKNGVASTNTIESMWAVFKRAYHGTFHYMSPKHLQKYADEFDFRHNEGNAKIPTMDRIGSLVGGCWGIRLTWRELIGH